MKIKQAKKEIKERLEESVADKKQARKKKARTLIDYNQGKIDAFIYAFSVLGDIELQLDIK